MRRAQLGIVHPRLAAEQAEPQAEIARFQAGKMLGQRAFQHRRIGRRAGDRGDRQFADRLHQQPALADAERNDRGAGGFQRGVVGEAAHPQPVVQAVHHAVPRPEPRGRLRPRADHRGLMRVAGRQREVHRRARGAGGAMHARDPRPRAPRGSRRTAGARAGSRAASALSISGRSASASSRAGGALPAQTRRCSGDAAST